MAGISRIGIGLCLCALGAGAIGCGPSPAMQTRRPEPLPPNAVIVEACDETDDDAEAAAPAKQSVEYVRLDEWQSPPSAREMEARIEPRGSRPPEYVRLPSLTKHREIAPTTTYRTGRYWW